MYVNNKVEVGQETGVLRLLKKYNNPLDNLVYIFSNKIIK